MIFRPARRFAKSLLLRPRKRSDWHPRRPFRLPSVNFPKVSLRRSVQGRCFSNLPLPCHSAYIQRITRFSSMKIAVVIPTLALSVLLARAEDKIDFAKSIQPILEKRCVECHGEKKQKGDLRLDSKAELAKAEK